MATGVKTTRRVFVAGAAVSLGLASAPGLASAKKKPQPNIIFIMADDLGYADISCYGRTDYATPHIDRLAERGMRFMQAYANSPVCSATRTALMTGRYQYRLPVGLEEPLAFRDLGLPVDHPTLPSMLRDAGYTTALIGKWHLGQLPTYGPLQSGYDHFWGFRGGGVDYFTHSAMGNGDLWDGDTKIEESGYLTKLLGDHAIQLVERFAKSSKPFFMSLHFSAPHWPWEGPDDEAESKRLAGIKGLAGIMHYDGGDLKTYAAMVRSMDDQVGRLVQALKKNGIDDNTLIIFTSDNGGERFSNTWPFTGRKTELLEGGLRIPAIVTWPGRVAAGSSSEQVMITMDWVPTLLAAAGARADPRYPGDGMDLAMALRGGKPVGRTLYWRYMHMLQKACRSGDWKYLKILDNEFLFDVAADPLERANLKVREAATFDRLKQGYAAWEAGMLPLDPAAFTHGYTGAELPDHFGISNPKMIGDFAPAPHLPD
ncbi:Arylsulfatase [Novosphingobium lubricantis]|jgi:arylsulfatase A-like enzyme